MARKKQISQAGTDQIKSRKRTKKDVSVANQSFGQNEVSETKEVVVNNEDIKQQLFRRRMLLGNNIGEINTSPLTRDYNAQFGYPEVISKVVYQRMYDRDPIAKRVVQLYPLECWQQLPTIYDSDAPTQSDFEKQIKLIFEKFDIWSRLRMVDILSGIGNFGILLMGVGDGKNLSEPIDLSMKSDGTRPRYKLQYVRPFPHSQVTIAASESDRTNPRYGRPTMYRVQFQPNDIVDMDLEGFVDLSTLDIHWTRVIHIADNCEVSDIFGTPRLQLVFNTLLDLQKVIGSSGESFYKVAFPAFVIEATDNLLNTVDLDTEAMRNEIARYENNSQRWMALKNAHVNPLSASYSDPSSHVELCMKRIATALGCPQRILEGSERGELASSQDAVIWKKRLMERQISHITPHIIRPVVQYLIRYGMVDMPFNKNFHVEWPDLSADTQAEIYDIRAKKLEFIKTYADGSLDKFFSPKDFLIKFCDFNENEVDVFLENARKAQQENIQKEAAAMYKDIMSQGSGEEESGGGFGGLGGGEEGGFAI